LREHRELSGPSLPLLANFFSILLKAAADYTDYVFSTKEIC
jgi:hypothetical protein